jgi:ABC-type sugar transport system ATPase subunit
LAPVAGRAEDRRQSVHMSFLSLQNISKRFPGVVALDRVSFKVERASCHALLGENGAGKSTAGKILAGIYTPDSGEVLLEGEHIRPTNPLEARQLGIAMVHQELAFCPNMTVAENLCLGDLPRRAGWLDRRGMRETARRMLGEIELEMDVNQLMAQLTTGQEQLVQIAAAVGTGARLLIMDEPTSSLSAHETEHLFQLLRRLKKRGITVVYVSHRLEEIFRICDTATVLRDGCHAATEAVRETDANRIIHQMIGRELTVTEPKYLENTPGRELLRVEKLSSPGKFANISFAVRAGEIAGMAGLVGSGRSEIAQAIFGLDPAARGEIFIRGEAVGVPSIQKALESGVGFLPEDRKRQGLVMTMNCRENSSLAALERVTKAGFVQQSKERAMIEAYSSKMRVKTPSLETPISGLSGGNQQKIALIKWLARECHMLIADEPTRGVDVGAKAEIHRLLDELACRGMGILMISSELPELMNLSARILVMREGSLTGELQRADFKQAALMSLMAGVDS